MVSYHNSIRISLKLLEYIFLCLERSLFLPRKPPKKDRIVGGRGMLCQQVNDSLPCFLRHVAAILIRVSFVRTVVTVRIVRLPRERGIDSRQTGFVQNFVQNNGWSLKGDGFDFFGSAIPQSHDFVAQRFHGGGNAPADPSPVIAFLPTAGAAAAVPDRWLVNLDSDGSPPARLPYRGRYGGRYRMKGKREIPPYWLEYGLLSAETWPDAGNALPGAPMTRSTYAYYETGKLLPSVMLLKELAQYYHISLDELLDETLENRVNGVFFSRGKGGRRTLAKR